MNKKLDEQYFDEFFYKLKNFDVNLDKIDAKHRRIIIEAKNRLQDKKKFLLNYRDWDLHGDSSAPPQITFEHLQKFGTFEFIKLFIKTLISIKYKNFFGAFYDDLNILENTGCFDLMNNFMKSKQPVFSKIFKSS